MVWGALGAGLRNVVAIVVAVFALINFGGPIFGPWWTERVEQWNAPYVAEQAVARAEMTAKIDGLTSLIVELQDQLVDRPPRAFLQIIGAGILPSEGPFSAGGVVPILYLIRRNEDCPTQIQARFINEAGQIASDLTYEIAATRAAVTLTPAPFLVRVRLPENMPPGRYSYSPIITPAGGVCSGEDSIVPTPSLFFEVQ